MEFVRSKFVPGFFSYLYFQHFYRNCFELKKILLILRIYWNTLMKILHLKGYKWLLSHNQRVRNDIFGYRRYDAPAKHIKPFLKNIKSKDGSAQTITITIIICMWFIITITIGITIRLSPNVRFQLIRYSWSNQIQLKTNCLIIFQNPSLIQPWKFNKRFWRFTKQWFKIMTSYVFPCHLQLTGLGIWR